VGLSSPLNEATQTVLFVLNVLSVLYILSAFNYIRFSLSTEKTPISAVKQKKIPVARRKAGEVSPPVDRG